jgi:hypothetical protein
LTRQCDTFLLQSKHCWLFIGYNNTILDSIPMPFTAKVYSVDISVILKTKNLNAKMRRALFDFDMFNNILNCAWQILFSRQICQVTSSTWIMFCIFRTKSVKHAIVFACQTRMFDFDYWKYSNWKRTSLATQIDMNSFREH